MSGSCSTLKEIQRMSRVEYPHVRQVAHLALILFDALAPAYGWDRACRKLLRAAALLHDMGYAADPARHVDAGVALLRGLRIKGYAEGEHRLVTVLVALHSGPYEPVLRSKLYRSLEKPEVALELGAVLRLADGLDHSHIQDATLEHIEIRQGHVAITVRSAWYEGHLDWARKKADLWTRAFGRPPRLLAAEGPARTLRLQGVVGPEDSVPEAMRSLLYSQYRLVLDNLAGACRAEGSENLHALRVALRRIRFLFVFFKPAMGDGAYAEHRRFAQALTASLGHGRDAQLWMDLLDHVTLRKTFAKTPAWKAFHAREKRKVKRASGSMARRLEDAETRAGFERMAFFLRVELPELIERDRASGSFSSFAARRLGQQLERLARQPCVTPATDPEIAHEYRKLVRRTRYFAEFSEPALPSDAAGLTRQLKSMTDALGTLQDTWTYLARIEAMKVPPPAPFVRYVWKQREKAWATYEKARSQPWTGPFAPRGA